MVVWELLAILSCIPPSGYPREHYWADSNKQEQKHSSMQVNNYVERRNAVVPRLVQPPSMVHQIQNLYSRFYKDRKRHIVMFTVLINPVLTFQLVLFPSNLCSVSESFKGIWPFKQTICVRKPPWIYFLRHHSARLGLASIRPVFRIASTLQFLALQVIKSMFIDFYRLFHQYVFKLWTHSKETVRANQ